MTRRYDLSVCRLSAQHTILLSIFKTIKFAHSFESKAVRANKFSHVVDLSHGCEKIQKPEESLKDPKGGYRAMMIVLIIHRKEVNKTE
jgi:hypothetical protein